MSQKWREMTKKWVRNGLPKVDAECGNLKNSINEFQVFFKREQFEIGGERWKIRHKIQVWVRENEEFCSKIN